MEQLQQNIIQLTGAINAQIEQIRVIEVRLSNIERINEVNQAPRANAIIAPRNELELESIRKLPDSVRDLQTFEGNPIQYVSWVHSVESILRDYELVREKPIYGAILRHIRQKIRGAADNALISYNIFDDQWETIKKCLSLHYADKRDIQSLENQLLMLRQGRDSISHFYNKINHQLSLIINKIKSDDYSTDGAEVLIANYRQRALDVFIRGLHQNLCHLIKVQKPETLPEAYTACLELQNLDFRKNMEYPNIQQSRVRPSNPQTNLGRQFNPQTNPNRQFNLQPDIGRQPQTQYSYQPQNPNTTNIPQQMYYRTPFQVNTAPPRPSQPKPPTPMEVDRSIHSAKVNYINRPNTGETARNMRVFNLETDNQHETNLDPNSEIYHLDSNPEIYHLDSTGQADEFETKYEDKVNFDEVNFMETASQEFPT